MRKYGSQFVYSREQNANCKLTEKDIQEIKDLYKRGNSSRYIARLYGVSKTAILYWVNPLYRKKVITRSLDNPERYWDREERHKRARKYYQKKRKITPEYSAAKSKLNYKQRKQSGYYRKYYKNNAERIRKYALAWYHANKTKNPSHR